MDRAPARPPRDAREDEGGRLGDDEVARLAKELRYQRDLMRTVAENAAVALFMMDKNGMPIFMNRAACAMTGYSGIEEIRDKPLHEAVHFKRPDGSPYPMAECPIDRANAEIHPLQDQPEVFCRKDGSLFPVRYNVAPIERDGERLGAVLEVRDVTNELRHEAERTRLLEAAQGARERLEALFMQAPAAIAIVEGDDHVFSFVNDLYIELVEKDPRELLGTPARLALPELVEGGFIALLDGVRRTGETFHAEGVPFRRRGAAKATYHNFVYQPIRGRSGAVESILGLAVDVSAQVEAELETRRLAQELELRVDERTRDLTEANEELRQANDALRSFGYVISHDLKEPVRAVENYLTEALETLPAEIAATELVVRARESNRRQYALIEGLLAYSRASIAPAEPRPVDLDRVLREDCKGYYEALARERHGRVRIDRLPEVCGDPVLLVQLFGNLILNALRHNARPDPMVHVHAAKASDGGVTIFVDDNGGGFSRDVKQRLRELSSGQPSTIRGGFGLAIASRAAERMGGTLTLEDNPSGGARATVRLETPP